MQNSRKKILISTVDCWNNKVGANSMTELFSDYGAENIANIYIRPEAPNSNVCKRYFQISENNVLKSIINKDIKTGRFFTGDETKIDAEVLLNEKNEKKRYDFFRKYRLWIFLYLREYIWKIGKWKSKELDSFVNEFNPDVLFFPIEGYIHFNRINEYLVNKTGKKAIGILWDDNFTYKVKPWYEVGYFIHRFFLRKSVKNLVSKCDTIFTINPKIKAEADREFNINSILLTKPIDFNKVSYTQHLQKGTPLKMVYTGNLFINRDKTLIKIVSAIEQINKSGTKIILDVYTTTKLQTKVYNKINIRDCCNIKGAVSQNEVIEIQKEADILLFCEALAGRHKYDARLSFSTKLTDYFSQGKCIFAVGPKDIAPIEYLEENDCAVVANNEKEIYEKLKKLITDTDQINSYGKKAFDIGYKNHNKSDVLKKLYEVLL